VHVHLDRHDEEFPHPENRYMFHYAFLLTFEP
jgi:hypothetical protein